MGGGSMMRAAAKVAGVGVVSSGLRGGVVPESPISAAARAASRPIGVIATKSSSDSVQASVAIDEPSVEKPVWFDWEFAGAEKEVLVAGRDPLPRLVFGGAPTIEEAKEATTELKDALEKVLVSSPRSSGCESLYGANHSPCLSQLSNSEVLENKACLTSTFAPNHAIRAFKFLDQSPDVQGVVASIVSDPNVWNAVLHNQVLQGFLQSRDLYQNVGEPSAQGDVLYQECPRSFEVSSEFGKADADIPHQTSPKNFGVASETGKSDAGESNAKKVLWGIWENIKVKVADIKVKLGKKNVDVKDKVVDMMSNLSDFFNSLFGDKDGNKAGAHTNPFPGSVEKLLGQSLVGVVVMVIMLVVLKRV